MSESEYRCKTCNHKYTKHFWASERDSQFISSGHCMKRDCDCRDYTTTTAEKTHGAGVFIVAVLVMFGIFGVVGGCNDAIGNNSPDDGQCTVQSTRGPEPC